MRPGVFSTRTGCCTTSSAARAVRRSARPRVDVEVAHELARLHARGGGPQRGRALHGSSARSTGCSAWTARRRVGHGHDLEVRDVLDEVVLDQAHHRLEHVEALALPLGERVLLAHRAEVDALAEVVHLVEVLAPVLVDHREHHAPLDLAELVGADRLLLRLVEIERVVDERARRAASRWRDVVELLARDRAWGDHVRADGRAPRGPSPRGTRSRQSRDHRAIDRALDRLERLVARSPPSRICWRRR